MADYRAEFDAEVTFLNGGGLQAQGFRLDIPGPDVSEPELAAAFVRQLGLLMTDQVRLSAVRILQEPHKGLRGRPEPATAGRRGRMVELSHVVTAGMVTFPGLPGPEISQHLTREESRAHYAPGTEFEIGQISMVGNTGTYLDSPYHRYPEGADLAGLPLDALADLPAVVVRVTGSGSRGIGVGALAALDVTGSAVLLHTGWDRYFGTPAYSDPAPYLTAEGARWLVDHGARLVGIDSINIDDLVEGGERPAHSTLLPSASRSWSISPAWSSSRPLAPASPPSPRRSPASPPSRSVPSPWCRSSARAHLLLGTGGRGDEPARSRRGAGHSVGHSTRHTPHDRMGSPGRRAPREQRGRHLARRRGRSWVDF